MANAAIDALRDSSGCLDRQALRSILPYGDDFLFVDRVSKLTESDIEATYTVPADSAWIRSHFEGLPIMPGALISEGMAQAATLLVRYNLDDHERMDVLAFQVDNARFSSPAAPGDTLRYRVRLLRQRGAVARLEGETGVGERLVCKADVVLAIVERDRLRLELETLSQS